MAKPKMGFVCSECEFEVIKWVGKCPGCFSWNSFTDKVSLIVKNTQTDCELSIPKTITEIKSNIEERYLSKTKEFDRALGGGLVKGSLSLVAGNPGVGKSTLVMQMTLELAKLNKLKVLYVSGEESESQVANRAKRLGIGSENFYILNSTKWEKIKKALIKLKPDLFVLDSIQTTIIEENHSNASTSSQIKDVTYEILNFAKPIELTCLVIGHVTKDGHVAGPKTLEHMVDTVLYFEGDKNEKLRLLSTSKNRFGDNKELGLFEMGSKGLKQASFNNKHLEFNGDSYGKSLTCISQGVRPVFVEVQSLVIENRYGNLKRITNGIDNNRMSLLIAMIDKYLETKLHLRDVFVNVVSGLRLDKRESDLSIIASIVSSCREKKIRDGTVFLGEVGLCGEVRQVEIENKIKEFRNYDIKQLIVSKTTADKYMNKLDFDLVGVKEVSEIESYMFS